MLPLAPLYAALAAVVMLGLGATRADRPRLLAWMLIALACGLMISALLPTLDDRLEGRLTVLTTLAVLLAPSLRRAPAPRIRALLALLLAAATWALLAATTPLAPRLPEQLVLPTLERLDGTPYPGRADSDPPQRPLLLVLWRSECAPCLAQLDQLSEAPLPAGTAELLLVNQGDSLLATLRALGPRRDGALRDPGQRLYAAAGAPGLPLTLLLDRDGRVLQAHLGAFSSHEWRRWHRRLAKRAMQ